MEIPRSPAELQKHLSAAVGKRVMLMVTENASTMLSRRTEGDLILLRAHRIFLHAPDEVVDALAQWIRGEKGSRDLVQEYIHACHDVVQQSSQERRPVLRPQGRVYDLSLLHSELNRLYLGGRSTAAVTWGRRPRRATRTIRLGSYDPLRHLITLSPRLDRRDVPQYMVEYVLFHEMLHEVLGIGERPDGRRKIHSKTFRLMEETFPDYERARAYEKKVWGG